MNQFECKSSEKTEIIRNEQEYSYILENEGEEVAQEDVKSYIEQYQSAIDNIQSQLNSGKGTNSRASMRAVEVASEAKEGDTTERASSYIFIRSFKKADGSRFYYFTSITVSKDGREVVVSSQEKSRNKILRLLQEGSVIWRTPKDAATSSAERQGLDYEQPNEAETATKGSGITPQSTSSASEDTNIVPEKQETEQKNKPTKKKRAKTAKDVLQESYKE